MTARCRSRGFTLVELMIVLVIVAIVASLAGPGMRTFMVQQRTRTASYDLMADLVFARSEAVKRNSTVSVEKATDGWGKGWTIKDVDGNTLREHPALDESLTLAAGSTNKVDFTLDGRASPVTTFTLKDASGTSYIMTRCVRLETSGLPRATMSDTGSCS